MSCDFATFHKRLYKIKQSAPFGRPPCLSCLVCSFLCLGNTWTPTRSKRKSPQVTLINEENKAQNNVGRHKRNTSVNTFTRQGRVPWGQKQKEDLLFIVHPFIEVSEFCTMYVYCPFKVNNTIFRKSNK